MIRNIFGVICIAAIIVAFAFMNNSKTSEIIEQKNKTEVSGPIFGTQYGITVSVYGAISCFRRYSTDDY